MNSTRVAPRKIKKRIYENHINLPEDRQTRRVCRIRVIPMAKGCCRRVNRQEVPTSIKVVEISSLISESSLIKILVLGVNDRALAFFLIL